MAIFLSFTYEGSWNDNVGAGVHCCAPGDCSAKIALFMDGTLKEIPTGQKMLKRGPWKYRADLSEHCQRKCVI